MSWHKLVAEKGAVEEDEGILTDDMGLVGLELAWDDETGLEEDM